MDDVCDSVEGAALGQELDIANDMFVVIRKINYSHKETHPYVFDTIT